MTMQVALKRDRTEHLQGEVYSPDRAGIFDQHLKVEGKGRI